MHGHDASEALVVDLDHPAAPPRLVAPRRPGFRYEVMDHGDCFLIRTNVGAPDFKIVVAPRDAPRSRTGAMSSSSATDASSPMQRCSETISCFPLDVGGRPFGCVVEENVVLDLQPAQLLVEQIEFFINGHKYPLANSLAVQQGYGEIPGGHQGNVTKVRGESSRQPSAVRKTGSSPKVGRLR